MKEFAVITLLFSLFASSYAYGYETTLDREQEEREKDRMYGYITELDNRLISYKSYHEKMQFLSKTETYLDNNESNYAISDFYARKMAIAIEQCALGVSLKIDKNKAMKLCSSAFFEDKKKDAKKKDAWGVPVE
jgi:hypothetical protein